MQINNIFVLGIKKFLDLKKKKTQKAGFRIKPKAILAKGIMGFKFNNYFIILEGGNVLLR